MSAFSPSEAALEGFRITRENPRAVLAWALVSLAISLVLIPLMIIVAGPELVMLEQSNAAELTPDEAAAVMSAILPLYGLLVPLGLLVQAVMGGAVLRVVLRPQERGFGYLRLGRDEFRLMLLTLLYVLCSMGAMFVLVLAVGIVAGLISAVTGAGPQFFAAVAVTAVLCLLVWAAVRLSLCAAETFDSERLRPFDSWRLTRGHFWPLFGAYVLAFILCMIVVLLANVVFFAAAVLLMGGDMTATVQAASTPDLSSVGAYFNPVTVLYAGLNAILTPISYAILVSPPALAYRHLTAANRTF